MDLREAFVLRARIRVVLREETNSVWALRAIVDIIGDRYCEGLHLDFDGQPGSGQRAFRAKIGFDGYGLVAINVSITRCPDCGSMDSCGCKWGVRLTA